MSAAISSHLIPLIPSHSFTQFIIPTGDYTPLTTTPPCSKRKGLEKALYQVEEALKRAGPNVQSTDAGKAISELKTMLANGQEAQLSGPYAGDSPHNGSGSNKRPRLAAAGTSSAGDHDYDDDDSSDEEDDEFSPQGGGPGERKASVAAGNGGGGARRPRRASVLSQPPQQRSSQGSGAAAAAKPEERLAVDDAENPLQLLARASNLHLSPESGTMAQSPGTAASVAGPGPASSSVQAAEEVDPEMRRVETFFGTTHFNVDCGEDYDPVELGLVTEDEAEMLFDLYGCLLPRMLAKHRALTFSPASTKTSPTPAGASTQSCTPSPGPAPAHPSSSHPSWPPLLSSSNLRRHSPNASARTPNSSRSA